MDNYSAEYFSSDSMRPSAGNPFPPGRLTRGYKELSIVLFRMNPGVRSSKLPFPRCHPKYHELHELHEKMAGTIHKARRKH